jgi:lipid-binding SYLF domain-containing protein
MLVWMVVLATASDPDQDKEAKRLDACREVIEELSGINEGIPSDLFEKAACVAVIPGVKKAAIGIGGRFGFGAVACRKAGAQHSWGPPLMIELKGGSFGLQIGGQETDVVLLFMNRKGVDYLLRNKFTLGADASIAAGPVGRSAEAATDVQMRAEILSYSRSRGLFAGISLEGASLKQDERANRVLYGNKVSPKDLLFKPGHETPAAGRGFVAALDRISPRGPDK